MLQTELLIDNKTLLCIIIDTVDSYIETINVEEEVGLDDFVDHDAVSVGIHIHPQPINPHMQLNSL